MNDTGIKPICATVIKNKEIWDDIISEVMDKPSDYVIGRNKKSVELLKSMRKAGGLKCQQN
jgi:hypothetical protein